jgi:HD-GYP domain-containing protein (c-di-GMP phosphodiesterase class II)
VLVFTSISLRGSITLILVNSPEPMTRSIYYFRTSPWAGLLHQLQVDYRVVPLDKGLPAPLALQFPAVIADADQEDLERLEAFAPLEDQWCSICLLRDDKAPAEELGSRVFALLPERVPRLTLERTIERAFERLGLLGAHRRSRGEFDRTASDLETLVRVGIALSTERKADALLELILSQSRAITCCDAGSLYLVEETPGGGKHLVFKLTQSDSHSPSLQEYSLPIDEKSAAGYAAATATILNIPDAYQIENLPLRLNREFDRKFNYRTRSMLVVPMQNQKQEVIGILQLINAKREAGARLVSEAAVEEAVIPFSIRSQQLAASLASQAAVALENSLLYRDIQRLFEGFVKASITAIESRDPTTFGHSERVAKLTLGLADTVDRCTTGWYASVRFAHRDLQELRYAALLHDFGKVGVREHVLVKARKLYPQQLEMIRRRFHGARQFVELASVRKKLELIENGFGEAHPSFSGIELSRETELRRLDELLQFIARRNEPGPLMTGDSARLAEAAELLFPGPSGEQEPLLSAEEVRLLSIPSGTLDAAERAQIESHVLHSFRFLSQIPWTRELRNIPEIAKAHHEKLDGSGYPYHLKGEEIPLQVRMMTIADIYDALTASDRPYKRAVPAERALEIIAQDVKSQLLDPALFDLFLKGKVYQLTARA